MFQTLEMSNKTDENNKKAKQATMSSDIEKHTHVCVYTAEKHGQMSIEGSSCENQMSVNTRHMANYD